MKTIKLSHIFELCFNFNMIKDAAKVSSMWPKSSIEQSRFICEMLTSQSVSDIDINALHHQTVKIDGEFQYCAYCPIIDSLIHFQHGFIGSATKYECANLPQDEYPLTDYCWNYGDTIGSLIFNKPSPKNLQNTLNRGDSILTGTIQMVDQVVSKHSGKIITNITFNDLIKNAALALIKNGLPMSSELYQKLEINSFSCYKELFKSGIENIDLGVKYIISMIYDKNSKPNIERAMDVFTSFMIMDKFKSVQDNKDLISEAIIKNDLDIIQLCQSFKEDSNLNNIEPISHLESSLLYLNLLEHQAAIALTITLDEYLNKTDPHCENVHHEIEGEYSHNTLSI